MGADGVLVSFPVFKTERPARVVGGEFDSHTLPPNLINKDIFELTSLPETTLQGGLKYEFHHIFITFYFLPDRIESANFSTASRFCPGRT